MNEAAYLTGAGKKIALDDLIDGLLLIEPVSYGNSNIQEFLIREANRGAEILLGVENGFLQGKSSTEFDSPVISEIRNYLSPAVAKYPERERRFEFEGRHLSLYALSWGEGILITIRDIGDSINKKISSEENLEKYKIFSGLSSDFLYELAVKGTGEMFFLQLSGNVEEVTGYPPKNFSDYSNFLEIVHPEDLKKVYKSRRDMLIGGPGDITYRIKHKSGQTRWIREKARPHWDEAENRVTKIYCSALDITSERNESQSYKDLVDNSLQGIFILHKGKIAFANRAAYMITGYTPEELKNMGEGGFKKLVEPEDLEYFKYMQNSFKLFSNKSQSIEIRIKRRGGERRWLEIFPSPIGYDGGIAMQNICIDITERKEAEDKLKLLSRDRQMLLDYADVHIWYMASRDEYGKVNKTHADFLGKKPEELENKKLSEYLDLAGAGQIEHHAGLAYSKRESVVFRAKFKAPAGEARQFDIKITPVLGESGSVEYAICSAVDITEQNKKEESIKKLIVSLKISKNLTEERAEEIYGLNRKLRESEKELRKINAAKDTFFSIIAHDLKSPLTGLMGLTKTLARETGTLSKEEIAEYSESLYDTSENIYKLLENLLHWSRLQLGSVECEPERINLSQIASIVIGLLKTNASNKNIHLENGIPSQAEVMGGPNMVHTIIRNLVSNGIKFTPEGGSVKLYTTPCNGKYECLCVEDDGVGMSLEEMGKLFKIDRPHTSEGTAKEKGTGLGLILCKELVERCNGRIWANSAPGVGSKFYIALPSAAS